MIVWNLYHKTKGKIMNKNFYIYVDREGKMPILAYKPMNINSHPYYTNYVNNRPVLIQGPIHVLAYNGKIWDYNDNNYVPIDGIAYNSGPSFTTSKESKANS
jgi:hypothetical protein